MAIIAQAENNGPPYMSKLLGTYVHICLTLMDTVSTIVRCFSSFPIYANIFQFETQNESSFDQSYQASQYISSTIRSPDASLASCRIASRLEFSECKDIVWTNFLALQTSFSKKQMSSDLKIFLVQFLNYTMIR